MKCALYSTRRDRDSKVRKRDRETDRDSDGEKKYTERAREQERERERQETPGGRATQQKDGDEETERRRDEEGVKTRETKRRIEREGDRQRGGERQSEHKRDNEIQEKQREVKPRHKPKGARSAKVPRNPSLITSPRGQVCALRNMKDIRTLTRPVVSRSSPTVHIKSVEDRTVAEECTP